MRKYDKKVETELAKLCSGFSGGKFVLPIPIDYPECDEKQMLLFKFLSSYGKKRLFDLCWQNVIDIPPNDTIYSINTSTGKVYRCALDVETYVFPYKEVKVVIRWDHGLIYTRTWMTFPMKGIHFSRYRLEVKHSDGEWADVSNITNEQVSTLLESVKTNLKKRDDEADKLHKKELESILTKVDNEHHFIKTDGLSQDSINNGANKKEPEEPKDDAKNGLDLHLTKFEVLIVLAGLDELMDEYGRLNESGNYEDTLDLRRKITGKANNENTID